MKFSLCCFGFRFTENSVNIPGIDETCFYEANNPQFQYETEESLNQQLQKEYGNVSWESSYVMSLSTHSRYEHGRF